MDNGKIRAIAIALALSGLLATGCRQEAPPASGGESTEAESFIGRQVAKGMAEAQRKLETENIRVGSNSHIRINGRSFGAGRLAEGLPKAEITPGGALLIDGEEVPATPAQRELLLDYRGNLVGLAQAGMAIGAKGADIAGTALTGIGQALFGGEEGRKAYEERIEAEAAKIEGEAVKLCALMPELYASQQALAAAMPEFAPYATMTREDVEECGEDDGDADGNFDASTTARWSGNHHGAMK